MNCIIFFYIFILSFIYFLIINLFLEFNHDSQHDIRAWLCITNSFEKASTQALSSREVLVRVQSFKRTNPKIRDKVEIEGLNEKLSLGHTKK